MKQLLSSPICFPLQEVCIKVGCAVNGMNLLFGKQIFNVLGNPTKKGSIKVDVFPITLSFHSIVIVWAKYALSLCCDQAGNVGNMALVCKFRFAFKTGFYHAVMQVLLL